MLQPARDIERPLAARSALRSSLRRGALTLFAFLAASTAAGFLGRLWWVLDLASHFRLQYLAALVATAALLLASGSRRWAAAAAILAVLNLALCLPLYLPPARPETAPGGTIEAVPARRSLRVLLVNIHARNPTPERAAAAVLGSGADVVALLEVTLILRPVLKPLEERFPWHRFIDRTDEFGVALLSRRPLAEVRPVYFADSIVPSLVARIADLGITVIATHPPPPVEGELSRARDRHLLALAEHVASLEGPVIVMGDLNTTSWSHVFGELLERSGLVDSRRGFGIQPTWPVWNPLLRIPIDHCLVSPGLTVRRREVGEPVGSDHLPVLVELSE